MILTLLAALATVGAALTGTFLLFAGLSNDAGRDGSRLLATMMVGPPFLACVLVAHGVGLHRGVFDWVLPSAPAGARIALVILALVGAAAVAAASVALRFEPRSQVPWAMLPVRSWIYPPALLLLVAGCALSAWPGNWGHHPAWRWPAAALSVVALMVVAGLLVQTVQWQFERQAELVRRHQADQDRRDASILKKIQDADPVKDFISLLPQTSAYENDTIRQLALHKVLSHPDLTQALSKVLRGAWPDEAMTFLAHNDPPDAAALIEPLHEGIRRRAQDLRQSVRNSHTLRPDDYLYSVRRLLAAADRLAPGQATFVDDVREVRAAFDEPRPRQPVDFDARRELDAWLVAHSRCAGGGAARSA